MKILVLGGGNGSEREVSRRSSTAVREALDQLGHDVRFVDPAEGEAAVREGAADCDLVLPMLHGTGGEDGIIQELLNDIGKPYLGSGAAASRLCFDKAKLKAVLAERGIQTARGEIVDLDSFASSDLIRRPFVLKPVADGSSVGTMIVTSLPYDQHQAKTLLQQYGRMLLEEYISGTEITVPVLGTAALPVIEIVPPAGKVFDFENKYNGATQELCPPLHVPAELQERAQRLAEQVHAASDARHLSRTDMIIDAGGRVYVLELNTMPGMTGQSLFPKAAAAAGLDWPALVSQFVELATSGSVNGQ